MEDIMEDIIEILKGIIKAYQKKDIKKVVKYIEKINPWLLISISLLAKKTDQELGKQIGLLLGDETNQFYNSLSKEMKAIWKNERWLHHGALGVLLLYRGRKKSNAFLIGLGQGLMESDLQDLDKWFDYNFEKAFAELKKMK